MPHDLPPTPVAEGDVIAGKYRVSRVLGAGGMGVVVAAVHVELHQRVALKFLLREASAYPELTQRFAREARAAAQIQSEHVARVIDVGSLENGTPYMVMEYLDGQDLADVLAASGPLPVTTAVGHILQACEAVAEAHVLGIVHRDLKPANLFLAKRPHGGSIIKVLDFGISKITTGNENDLTRTGSMVGSPAYMAPEQFKAAKSVDARIDQWALGVILYELLAGRKPFVSETLGEIFWVIVDRPHAPLVSLNPAVPAELGAIVDRCLAKEPSQRFPSIAELALALAAFGPEWATASAKRTSSVLGREGAEAPTDVLPATTPPPVTPESSEPRADAAATNAPWSRSSGAGPTPTPAPRSERRSLGPPIFLGVGAAVAVAAFVFVGSQRAPSAPANVAPAEAQESALTPPAAPAPRAAVPPLVPALAPAPPSAPVVAPPLETPRVEAPRSVHPKTAPAPLAAPVKLAPSATAPPPPPVASTAPPACETVTYYDADGMKHFKQVCP